MKSVSMNGVCVQAKENLNSFRSHIEDASNGDGKLESAAPAIMPPPTLPGVTNNLLITFGTLAKEAKKLGEYLECLGLSSILWNVREKTSNLHAEMAPDLRKVIRCGLLLITAREWKDWKIQNRLGIMQGMSHTNNVIVLLRKDPRTRIRDLSPTLARKYFEYSASETLQELYGFIYPRVDQSIQENHFFKSWWEYKQRHAPSRIA